MRLDAQTNAHPETADYIRRMRKRLSVPTDLLVRLGVFPRASLRSTKPFLAVLSIACFAILQAKVLKGQGATEFQHDCASCHALPGTGSGPALSSTVGLRRSGWGPLVGVMDQYGGYHFTADIPAIAAYLDSLYPIASPSALPGGTVGTVYGP